MGWYETNRSTNEFESQVDNRDGDMDAATAYEEQTLRISQMITTRTDSIQHPILLLEAAYGLTLRICSVVQPNLLWKQISF
jgi:hypothetical protein